MLRGPTRAGRLLAPPIRMAVAARGVSGESSNAYLQFEPKAQVTSPRTLLVLHGMLGSKKNWRSFTRRLLRENQAWQAILVDHRGHGESPSMHPPHTVNSCAADLHRLCSQLGVRPDAVLGHSFGGKVAIEFARLAVEVEAQTPPPAHTWVLDSMAGPVEETIRANDDGVANVIRSLREIPMPIESKEALVEAVTGLGFSHGLAQWMTTNLDQHEDGFRWVFDLDVAWELFEDYCSLDETPFLRRLQERNRARGVDPTRVSLVRAANNRQWTDQVLRHIHPSLAADNHDWEEAGVRMVTLPDAGHWVHIDNPDGLAALVSPSLQAIDRG